MSCASPTPNPCEDFMKPLLRSTLSLLFAGSLAGCFAGGADGTDNQQLLRGHVPLERYTVDIVGVRVIADGATVAVAKTDALGNFNIAVPVGSNYSFELVSSAGTHAVLAGPLDGPSPMNFDVCDPGADFDLGDINPFDFEQVDGDAQPWGHPQDDCSVPPWICEGGASGGGGPSTGTGPNGGPSSDPNAGGMGGMGPDGNSDPGTGNCWNDPLPCQDPMADPSFCWNEPLPCSDPAANSDFCWDEPMPCTSGDPADCQPQPPMPCESTGPNGECYPPPPIPCNSNDPSDCQPPPPLPCDGMGPNGDCPPMPCDGTGPNAGCQPPSEPCDAMDPTFCEPPQPLPCGPNDPTCVDPGNGGCMNGYDDPSCWPDPNGCVMTPNGGFMGCDASVGGAPQFPFPNFGCAAN